MDKTEYRKIMDDFEKKYKTKLAIQEKNVYKFDLTERLKDIYDDTSNKILKKCQKEIEELNKVLDGDFLTAENVQPIKGKELEAAEKYKKFYICSFYPNSIINKMENLVSYSNKLNIDQLNLCKEDCYADTKEQNIEMGKLCIKKCLDFSFKYSKKASYDIMITVLDSLEKEIKKL